MVTKADIAEERASVGSLDLREKNEEVFLARLHWRALLLNEGFQAKVLQVIGQHEVANSRKLLTVSSTPVDQSMFTATATLTRGSSASPTAPSKTWQAFFTDLPTIKRGSSAGTTATGAASSDDSRTSIVCDCMFTDGAGSVEVEMAPVKT